MRFLVNEPSRKGCICDIFLWRSCNIVHRVKSMLSLFYWYVNGARWDELADLIRSLRIRHSLVLLFSGTHVLTAFVFSHLFYPAFFVVHFDKSPPATPSSTRLTTTPTGRQHSSLGVSTEPVC